MRVYNDPFLRFLANSSQMENQKRNCRLVPATNVMEIQDAFRIEMAVPGFSKKEISISVEKNILKVSSEREQAKNEEGTAYTRREFGFDNFCRSFELPETVDQENIRADFKNGILTLNLPKNVEVKIKKEIQIA